MRSPQALARRRLDDRLAGVAAEVGPRPAQGWIRAIRTALGMSTKEMAQRMGVTQSRVSQLEHAEADDSIHLGTLRRAAEALGCELHYVFVRQPRSKTQCANRPEPRRRHWSAQPPTPCASRTKSQRPPWWPPKSTRSQTTSLTHQVCGPPPDERTVSDPLLAVGDGHTPLDPDDRLGLKPAWIATVRRPQQRRASEHPQGDGQPPTDGESAAH